LFKFVMKANQVFRFKESREMEFCFTTIVGRTWVTNILIFSVLILNTGCGINEPSASRTLAIKPSEEMMEQYHERLRIAKELTLETEICSQIIISQETPNYFVEYLKANLRILPVSDGRQKISDLEIIPPGEIVDRSIEFELDAPPPGRHEFRLKAETVSRHEFYQVTDKIPFPLQAIPTGQIKYTRPSLIVDSDDEEIRTLASSIAQGEDDLYRVVFEVSKWVRENVQAHIDTSTISTSQKASWVLENRKGVCDEKTNLFIGFLRSLGIPAKFIIGLVGINYNDTIHFKPHGWAEVYFPSAGWIPFDVAYNQLGFIDATHIKLTESFDTSDPLTSYEWKSVDISDPPNSYGWKSDSALVSIKDLEIKTKIKKRAGSITPLLEIKPTAWYRNLDVGSYNVVEATVANPRKFYVITDISLQTPNDLEIMGRNTQMVLMEPDTRKMVHPANAGVHIDFE
jgi:transglutaminase-like putative cysteine protease